MRLIILTLLLFLSGCAITPYAGYQTHYTGYGTYYPQSYYGHYQYYQQPYYNGYQRFNHHQHH